MTSASLSALDPTLIEGARSQLAEDFAKRIFDTVPDISECIEFEAEACNNVAGKKRFERASQLLYSSRRDLQSQVSAVFRRIFDERLFRLLDANGRKSRVSLDGMMLLSDERLNEEIAVNHCSRRLKEQSEFELWGLTRRVAAVTGIDYPKDSQNPVSPQVFAQALLEAIGSLETDSAVRLVVFRTFGPALLDIVPAVFVAANTALTARGIDVESAEYYGRPVVTPERQPLPPTDEMSVGAAKMNMALTSALTQILANSSSVSPVRDESVQARTSQKHLPADAPSPTDTPNQVAEPAWHGKLQDIEKTSAQTSVDQLTGPRTLHDPRLALQEKLNRDEQVVSDIITVMFDRLLVDPRIPQQLREIVARLQLPVLELALKDRSLLTHVHHPVRKLLDLIAEFGLTLDLSDNDDSTVRSVSSIVDGLVLIRNEEPNAFKLAFDRLDSLFYHREEAALLNDDVLRSLERDEAAEFAGSQADREIALHLQNRTLPHAICSFIQTAWREVLIHGYLHGGSRGDLWKLALSTLDDIVKSLCPSTSATERQRLATTLTTSIQFLLDGAKMKSDQAVDTEDFFAEMRRARELIDADRAKEIAGERFVPSLAALAVKSDLASPSATLAALGLACGDWIETRDAAGTRRWRLSWITSIMGTCVFKHYESNTVRNMGCEELRERLLSGEVQRVRGLGLADDVLNSAFETVSRKARRDEAAREVRLPDPANHAVAILGASLGSHTNMARGHC